MGQRLTGGLASHRLGYLSLLILATGWLLMPSGRFDEVVYVPVIATLVSFVLTRVALSQSSAHGLTMAQKWLHYPALVAVYVPLLSVVMLGPVAMCGLLAIKAVDQFRRDRQNLEEEVAYLNNRIAKVAKESGAAEAPGNAAPNPMNTDLVKLHTRRKAVIEDLENYPSVPTVWDVALTPAAIIRGLVGVAGANWFLVGLFCTLFPGVVRGAFHPFAADFTRRAGFGLAILGLLMFFGGLGLFL